MIRTADIDGREIEYYLMDPTGNITILVVSFVPTENQPDIAAKLMNIENTCEQVGFVTRKNTADVNATGDNATGDGAVDIKLRMSAGEFCGNATMSTAALWCIDKGITQGEHRKVIVETTGADSPLQVDITVKSPINFAGKVEMPSPLRIYKQDFELENDMFNFPVVDFGGISHIILMPEDENTVRFALKCSDEKALRIMAEKAVKKWCNDIGATGLGMMFVNISNSYVNKSNNYVNQLSLDPLVYVPDCGTCFWESSCGSGTTATGAFLSNGSVGQFEFIEPGGILSIEVTQDGRYLLGGNVNIM